jgi:hypothetical protein
MKVGTVIAKPDDGLEDLSKYSASSADVLLFPEGYFKQRHHAGLSRSLVTSPGAQRKALAQIAPPKKVWQPHEERSNLR